MSAAVCVRCELGSEHPWHDNGEINLSYTWGPPSAPPEHFLEEEHMIVTDPDVSGTLKSFAIKDSGKRQEFEGGGMRDTEEGKLDWSNLFVWFEPMATRFVTHMTKGRTKYPDPEPGVPNWSLFPATPELLARTQRSLDRHYKAYRAGETDEDHAAAILFNLNLAERIKAELR